MKHQSGKVQTPVRKTFKPSQTKQSNESEKDLAGSQEKYKNRTRKNATRRTATPITPSDLGIKHQETTGLRLDKAGLGQNCFTCSAENKINPGTKPYT